MFLPHPGGFMDEEEGMGRVRELGLYQFIPGCPPFVEGNR